MTDPARSEGSVTAPCIVQECEGDVVLECGVAGTSLKPAIARNSGHRMVAEADRIEGERTPELFEDGNADV